MLEAIDGMPPGTVGLRGSGKLTRDDYRDVLEPALRQATDGGEVRMLFVLSDFEGLEPGAWIEDVKTGLHELVGHHSAWKRLALVTDAEWIRRTTRTVSWLVPGELMIRDLDGLEDARSWVAG